MKQLSFTSLLLLVGLSPAFAQQKWELGLTAQMGNFTTPFSDQISHESHQERNSLSAGTTATFGVYAQRRISHSFALAGGLGYAVSQYTSRQELEYSSGLVPDDIRVASMTERSAVLPLTLRWLPTSRWSFGLGSTLSYHLSTEVAISHVSPQPPLIIPGIVFCGTGYYDELGYASQVQLLWNGSAEYRIGQGTSVGLMCTWSLKANAHPDLQNFQRDIFSGIRPASGQTLGYRLPFFPKSLAVSLRHNFLNTN